MSKQGTGQSVVRAYTLGLSRATLVGQTGGSSTGRGARTMEWKVHGERPIYISKWVNLWLVDVELPDGQQIGRASCRERV